MVPAVVSFLPTPSVRRATKYGVKGNSGTIISTHALREEGDAPVLITRLHRPRIFLPTPSVRRATQLGGGHRLGLGNFYPRPP